MTVTPPVGVVPVLSAWDCRRRSAGALRGEVRMRPETSADLGRVPSGVARAAVRAYSRPGDTVADPDAGCGTVLIESLCEGRHAIGLTPQSAWARVARQDVAAAKRGGAWPDAIVLTTDQGIAGPTAALERIDLVVTALRCACSDPDEDPAVSLDDATARLAAALSRCVPWLRRGARAVVAAHPVRGRDGQLLDTVGALYSVGRSVGLIPDARCVALTGAIHSRRITIARNRAGRPRSPASISAHWDVVILRLPELAIRTSAVSLLSTADRPGDQVSIAPTAVLENRGRAA